LKTKNGARCEAVILSERVALASMTAPLWLNVKGPEMNG